MSTGSLFWGTSKGRLGNVVYRVRRGREVASKYQPNVDNPRTVAQMNQRALFAAAVKFYKSAVAKMFKFAYEDRGAQESDYNAFMRHNVTSGMILTKEMNDSPLYPSVGNEYILSYGSLPTLEVGAGMDTPYMAANGLEAYPGLTGVTSFGDIAIADISRYLIEQYGFENGDLFTIVRVSSLLENLGEEAIEAPTWQVIQIRVDTSNYNPYGSVYPMNNWVRQLHFDDSQSSLILDERQDYICGYAAIHSKQSGGRLLVSTQSLVLNDAALNYWYDSFEQPYYNNALATWGAQTDGVLQGAVADGDMETITTFVKDLKRAKFAWAVVKPGTWDATSENNLREEYNYEMDQWGEELLKFQFKSTGVPATNQFVQDGVIPVNGVGMPSEGDDLIAGYIMFIFDEAVQAAAFNNEDFTFVWTSSTGRVVTKTCDDVLVGNFNPSAGQSSLYALAFQFRDDQDTTLSEDVPEYTGERNCQCYYKGVFIGRCEVIWYRNLSV